MKKSRCGGSLDGVDFKVYQRRASSLTPKCIVGKQGSQSYPKAKGNARCKTVERITV